MMLKLKRYRLVVMFLYLSSLLISISTGAGAQAVPQGGTTAPLLWLKADAGVYSDAGMRAAVDGGAVQEWVDQSGHGTVFAQTVDGRQPVLVNQAIHGMPAVRFTYNGAGQVNLASSSLSSASGSYTVLMVVSDSLVAGSSGAWGLDSQNGRLVFATSHDGAAYGWYDGAYHYFGTLNPGWRIMEWVLTAGGTGQVLVNGVSQGTEAYTSQPLGGTTSVGGAYDTNGAPLNGDLAEMIVYNTALTREERSHLRVALGTKYGIKVDAATADSAVGEIAPGSLGILYSPYNWLVTTNAAKSINAGAYFRTQINATMSCKIGLSVGTATPYSQVYARLDNGAWQQYVPVVAGAQTWTLHMPSPTTSSHHLLEFVIKSTTETQDRWNAQATAIGFTGLTLDAGGTVSRPAARKYRVLIFGDSITEGVRVNGYNGIPNDTDRNDNTLDYSYQLGELLDAEIGIVGFGATGMTAGGSGGVPPLSTSYRLLWSGQDRTFLPVPDLVIYNEGTNEGGASELAMLAAFQTVVKGIGYARRTNTSAGLNGTRHLILRPFNGAQAANLAAIAASFHSANIVFGDTTGFWSSADASDGLHPYAYAHLGQIAPQVAALALPLLHPSVREARQAHH